ncbi:MAG: M81 family metallopeptidase [Pseudomonadota bacterium]
MRIAVGGFQHETNTFAPDRAEFAHFEMTDAWPGLTRGASLLEVMAGRNIPFSGFVEQAQKDGWDLVPLLWCSAEPSSYVSRDAFERVTAMFCEDLAAAGPLDGLYLDLHGAMVCDHEEDGEGALLARLRDLVGLDLPIFISLDLHANVTQRMVELADGITIFRTYPHLDMAETGARACALMSQHFARGSLCKAFRKLPYLIPLTAQFTGEDPIKSLYDALPGIGSPEVFSADFAAGFPPSDIEECGPGLVVYGSDPGAVDEAADRVFDMTMAAEAHFDGSLLEPDLAVARAIANEETKPVVLADAQDNPGAGATSDTVGLLAALLEADAEGAVLGVLNDPEAAAQAHAAGCGAIFAARLGATSKMPGHHPLMLTMRVEALSDGIFDFTGEMYAGSQADVGPMALVAAVAGGDFPHFAGTVRVVVGSQRLQCLDQAIFRHLGVKLETTRIIAVKSTVHFRADFDPLASETLVAAAPGAHPCRLETLNYKFLRPGVRRGPNGPVD